METEGINNRGLVATPTTTTPILAAWQNLPNPCKFRGNTIKILDALNDCGSLTTKEIAGIVNIPVKRVGQYCRLGQKNAIFQKIDLWKWKITDFGIFVLEISSKYNIEGQSKDNQRIIEGQSKDNRTLHSEKKQHQLNLDVFLEKEDLTEDERTVVVAMVKHYEESAKRGTPRPYIYVRDYYQFRGEVGLEAKLSEENVQDITIGLEAAGILFRYHQGEIIKIGLTKKTIENMRNA